MVYNPNIPQAGDFIGQSQAQIQQNFEEISTQFSQDHVLDSSLAITTGKHKKISYNEQSVDPVTIADEAALYTKDNSGQPEIFFAPESAGTVQQFTEGGVWEPGLKVEANVVFDIRGNIIEEPDPTAENPNNMRNLASNVSSVSLNSSAGVNSWTINFTTAISSADYFWVFGGAFIPRTDLTAPANRPIVFTPTNTATYSDSVKTTSLSVTGWRIGPLSGSDVALGRTLRLNVIIYTVG